VGVDLNGAVKRICVLGGKSTGKTTLARDLAQRFGTIWVPEYGHVSEVLRRTDPHNPWTAHEFVSIARMQVWCEDFLAEYANDVLFCDTDVFTTGLWQQRLTGSVDAGVLELAERRYDLYVLCEPADGYRARVERLDTPFIVAHGTPQERVDAVVGAIEAL
jgi:HTH-type transcriptional regulator, transcriptional repressor of NAD biosynthesis genes